MVEHRLTCETSTRRSLTHHCTSAAYISSSPNIVHSYVLLHPQPHRQQTIMRLPSIANHSLRTARGFATSTHLSVPLLLTPKQFNSLPKVSIYPRTVTFSSSCIPHALGGRTMFILLTPCPYSHTSKLLCLLTPHGICPILLAQPWPSTSMAHAFPMLCDSTWMK